MRAAVIVVDMVKDTLQAGDAVAIARAAQAIVAPINELCAWARKRGWPVVFACDSFLPDDFIFRSKMKPHSLRGTDGARVADELVQMPDDVFLPKRRFSAFFKTDLDQSLRTWGVDLVCVCGISTHICVLTSALDAIGHDFSAIIVEDATAAPSPEIHEHTLASYRRSLLFPLLRVLPRTAIYALADQ